ncbi:MAG: EamA family transporter [Pseudomonadota bacterium]
MVIPNNILRGYLSVMAAAVMWASSGTAGKALFNTGITPFALVQVRVTVSSLILAFVLSLYGRKLFRIRLSDLGYFFLLGGVMMALVQITYFYTISKIQVAAAIFIQYLSPIMVAFFAILFWKERLTLNKLLSLFLSCLGCYLVVGGYSLQLLKMNRVGLLCGVFSAICFAAYTLIGERGMHRYSPWTVIFYALLFAALSWHIFYPPFEYLWAGYSLQQWGWMLYIAVVGTLLPFSLFFVGVNHIRSTRATITATLEPISAGFIAYLFLGETMGPLQVLGGALVICAIVLLQLRRDQDDLAPEIIRARNTDG